MALPLATLVPFIVKAIPDIIRAYKRLREERPHATDEEIFKLVQDRAEAIITRGQAWLDEH